MTRRHLASFGLTLSFLVALAGCHTIAAVEPPESCVGNVVRIRGDGFGFSQDASRVFFGGVEATEIRGWSQDAIDVVVPAGAVTAPVRVEALGETQSSAADFVVKSGGLACRGSMIPGPSEYGYDADLESLARKYDRQFHVFNAAPMAINADLTVALDRAADRELIRSFLQETDGWDFEAYAGKSIYDTVTGWAKTAGLYAGVGIAADAYRYGVLRDEGYPADEVARARQHLIAALEALHLAVDITGVDGVIARGFIRRDIPGDGVTQPTTPLFDETGNPLPPEKNNGTWREDNSGGRHPNYIWEDSCSRDQFIGWAAAMGAAWEVIAADPTFSDDVRTRLQADALALGRMLSTVQASGYDLEIQDADGRPTFHAYLNENAFDRIYLPFLPVKDGFYAAMSLGIVSSFVYTSGDAGLTSYLYDTLIGARRFGDIVAANLIGVDVGYQSNFSGVNMVAQGLLLAQRYVADPSAREDLITSVKWKFYEKPASRQPNEQGQTLYDFTFAAGSADASAHAPFPRRPDTEAMARGLQTLKEFPEPPYWDVTRTNCDADEIASGSCTADDGTHLDVLGNLGRNEELITVQPIPMRIRPPSNYHWRSNPYDPNGGGDGSRLLPGVDFRYVYWFGRWVS